MAEKKFRFTNADLADIFERIGALLEIKGDVIYKIRAYQRAAESLHALGEDVNKIAAEGRLSEIPAVGKAISEKIEELISTGRLEFLEKLEEEVPPTLLEVLQVPDVGPRKVALFWKHLGVIDLVGLEAAARSGKLRDLPGMGAKSEARIIAGIEALARRSDRMSLELAWSHATRWIDWLKAQPGVLRVEPAGSLRRWRETIGDLDLVASVGSDCKVMESFVKQPEVERVLGQGENKASVELTGGVRIQLWVSPPERFGSLLAYATGSKNHNVHMRELTLKQKLSLSDRGMENAEGKLITFADEESLYQKLGLAWTPPEMREDRGEIEAALKNELPELVETGDLKAELHAHTTWSDGVAMIAEMAQAAMARGYTTLAITDHSGYLGITGGLKVETLPQQRAEIENVQAEFGDKIRILHGIEVDITADGTLALPDESLAELDIVIASLHSSLRQQRETITARLLRAIHNPHVDMIAHPSGRLLPNREGADLDWEAVLAAARETGIALEINASPYRLDLNDVYARRAIEMGIPIAINTDAHSPGDMALAPYGISVARRAWAVPENIINTWPTQRITDWLNDRKRNTR